MAYCNRLSMRRETCVICRRIYRSVDEKTTLNPPQPTGMLSTAAVPAPRCVHDLRPVVRRPILTSIILRPQQNQGAFPRRGGERGSSWKGVRGNDICSGLRRRTVDHFREYYFRARLLGEVRDGLERDTRREDQRAFICVEPERQHAEDEGHQDRCYG